MVSRRHKVKHRARSLVMPGRRKTQPGGIRWRRKCARLWIGRGREGKHARPGVMSRDDAPAMLARPRRWRRVDRQFRIPSGHELEPVEATPMPQLERSAGRVFHKDAPQSPWCVRHDRSPLEPQRHGAPGRPQSRDVLIDVWPRPAPTTLPALSSRQRNGAGRWAGPCWQGTPIPHPPEAAEPCR